MTTAVFPGKFDPITNGHLDITRRAARLFDKVVVGVYETPPNKTLFTTEERVELIRQSTANLPNVEVASFKGLVVNFAKQVGAQTLVRGLRVGSDFEREFAMSLMNKTLSHDCELVCLMSDLRYQFLSSSLLKEAASLGGFVDNLVPAPVAIALKEKFYSAVKSVK